MAHITVSLMLGSCLCDFIWKPVSLLRAGLGPLWDRAEQVACSEMQKQQKATKNKPLNYLSISSDTVCVTADN